MTSPEDALRDLINELDRLHGPGLLDEEWVGYCAECNCFNAEGSGANCRPCPCSTMQIVDKYKRRAHRRRYILNVAPRGDYIVTMKPSSRAVYRTTNPVDAEKWIEQQYEENK